ncbi:MAG: ATP-binding protein [Clostridia bacterium]|nr:ATP-binding protein [Clostridia bacterium]NCD02131.1 ATP-binding protein [Clostridia bacterium]
MRVHELILYRNFEENIFYDMAEVANEYLNDDSDKEVLIDKLYQCINEIVTIARDHGFNGNLWHGYLTYLLTTNENAFSMSCEKKGAIEGSINELAYHDLCIFKEAYDVDWNDIEKVLGVHFISMIRCFHNPDNLGIIYSQSLRERIVLLNEQLAKADSIQGMYDVLTDFYKDYGVGKFGLHRAFKIVSDGEVPQIAPITRTDKVVLDDIVGYEIQKKKLTANTEAFIKGKKANNALLYGDSGTGKSTSIKAILNEYYKDGLRMIEVYKHQFKDISNVIAQIKNRNYKYILYMDDLSFEEFEIEYKYLKAIIEGGLETKPDNVVIYATSNRRHLIRETWSDRKQAPDDVHGGDSMQEKISLATRFGETIFYGKPDQKEYLSIARVLAKRYGIEMTEEEVEKEAVKWELSHGGRSGRTAQQFINHLIA